MGETVYAPDMTHPMLPSVATQRYWSLRAEDATGILLVHGLHDAGGRPVEPVRAAWSIEDPVSLIMDLFLSSRANP